MYMLFNGIWFSKSSYYIYQTYLVKLQTSTFNNYLKAMGIQAPTFFLSIRPGSYTYIKLPINSVFILYNVYSIMWLFSIIYIYIHPMMCNRCTHLYIWYITIILLDVCAYGVNGRKLWKDFFGNERHTLRKHEDCVSQCTRVHGPSIIIQRSSTRVAVYIRINIS
jgi:hypothetical protein